MLALDLGGVEAQLGQTRLVLADRVALEPALQVFDSTARVRNPAWLLLVGHDLSGVVALDGASACVRAVALSTNVHGAYRLLGEIVGSRLPRAVRASSKVVERFKATVLTAFGLGFLRVPQRVGPLLRMLLKRAATKNLG